MQMSVSDQIIHTTLRIECTNAEGLQISGTGFFYNFCRRETGEHIPAIVTNKHVINDTKFGLFYLTIKGDDGSPLYGNYESIKLPDFEEYWLKHPNTDVDLAVFPIAGLLNRYHAAGKRFFYRALQRRDLADAAFINELSAIEDIVMIGYPDGLWDKHNNLPMSRRGITATPPFLDFDNLPEFVIDCACFNGSSGSPVFLYNIGGYVKKDGVTELGGTRVKLLGVLYGAFMHTAEGEIRVAPAPTSKQQIARWRIPNNLGLCVKADQLSAFEEHFEQLILAQDKIEKSIPIPSPSQKPESEC